MGESVRSTNLSLTVAMPKKVEKMVTGFGAPFSHPWPIMTRQLFFRIAAIWLKPGAEGFIQQCRSGLKLVTLKRGKNDRTEKRISSPMKVKSKV